MVRKERQRGVIEVFYFEQTEKEKEILGQREKRRKLKKSRHRE